LAERAEADEAWVVAASGYPTTLIEVDFVIDGVQAGLEGFDLADDLGSMGLEVSASGLDGIDAGANHVDVGANALDRHPGHPEASDEEEAIDVAFRIAACAPVAPINRGQKPGLLVVAEGVGREAGSLADLLDFEAGGRR
jgi:hypothetical protein